VHGLTREDLLAKPKFPEVAKDFLGPVAGAELIIHNADFDVEFLDLELGRARLALKEHVADHRPRCHGARAAPRAQEFAHALCERYFVGQRQPHAARRAARRALLPSATWR